MLYSKRDLRTQWRVRIISLELLVEESDAAQDAAGLSDVGAHCCLRHRLSFRKIDKKKLFNSLLLPTYEDPRFQKWPFVSSSVVRFVQHDFQFPF